MSEEWRDFASCKGMPVALFFDDYEASAEVQLMVDNLCANCVVRMDCLEWALENKMEGGVFGRKYLGQSPKAKKRRKEMA